MMARGRWADAPERFEGRPGLHKPRDIQAARSAS